MIRTPDFKYPQKGSFMESKAEAEIRCGKAFSQNRHIGGRAGNCGSLSGAAQSGGYAKRQKVSPPDGIRYCRLVTDTFDEHGRPIRCYSVLAFRLEAHVVMDSAFIYDITRSRVSFERLMRVARREKLDPEQLRYLVEDMTAAGLL